MKGLLYQGPRDIRYVSFDDPKPAADTDAIVKLDKCGIRGSDPLSITARASARTPASASATKRTVMVP